MSEIIKGPLIYGAIMVLETIAIMKKWQVIGGNSRIYRSLALIQYCWLIAEGYAHGKQVIGSEDITSYKLKGFLCALVLTS